MIGKSERGHDVENFKVKGAKEHSHKHAEALNLLKTARGNLNATIKMIEDDRYCVDISTQILALIALLKKANISVVSKHMETCVKSAIETGDVDEKIEELKVLLKYMSKTM